MMQTDGRRSVKPKRVSKKIAIARCQEARSWELRIVTSVGRLLQTVGKRTEARALIGMACDSFTEGHETADFKAARILLTQL
jgi:hypothetical protein